MGLGNKGSFELNYKTGLTGNGFTYNKIIHLSLIIIIIIIFNTYIALFLLKYSKAHYNIINN